jgi:hypothetical protein
MLWCSEGASIRNHSSISPNEPTTAKQKPGLIDFVQERMITFWSALE